MMVKHHPTTELLQAFSAGTLPMSHALCISAHIDHCSDCRSNLKRLTNLGATLFESMPTTPTPDHLKTNVFAQLDNSGPVDDPETRHYQKQNVDNIPRCLHQFVASGYDSLSWRRVSPSIKSAKLCIDTNGEKVQMLRIKPGGSTATHTHTGDEYTVVLQGSFSDDSGLYCEGDFIIRNGNHKHKPTASKDKECICLTVTDSPIKFTGWAGRLLNPFVNSGYRTL